MQETKSNEKESSEVSFREGGEKGGGKGELKAIGGRSRKKRVKCVRGYPGPAGTSPVDRSEGEHQLTALNPGN